MSYPQYPPGGNPPYPSPYPTANYPPGPAYGFAPGVTPGYPQYPPAGAPNQSYPAANTGYPTQSWGSAPTGYPPQPGAANPSAGIYPNVSSGYPTSGYPPTSGPPANTGYPPTSGPPANTGYPPTSGPPASTGYPTNTGYPSSAGYNQGYNPNPGSYAPPSSVQYPGQSHSPTPPSYIPAGGNPQSPYSTAPKSPQHTRTSTMAYAPTLREYSPFQPEEDAKVLRKAMKGFGTDEKAIIDILGRRTNAQRQIIYVTYKTHYGRDLVSDLKSELGGRFEDAIVGMMTPTTDYLAGQLHKSIAGIGTKESTLIEILCSRTNHEIREINAAYLRLYKKPLEKHIIEDTSGHFRKLLVSLCMANRNENPSPDHARAAADAQSLYQAGAAQWGTDESVFNSILVAQSYAQLQQVFAEYQRLTGRSIEQAIQNEFSGDVEDGLIAIVKCARSIPAYLAERLYKSMSGAGTQDTALIRIIVTRCEIDMALIKQEFQAQYGKTLESFISGDTSGDYKRALLTLVQG